MFDSRLHQKTVDHDLDRVILPLVQANFVFQIQQFAVNAGAGETVLHQLLHLFLELALAPANDRSQHHHAIFGREHHHALNDLLRRLAGNRAATFRAVGHPDRGE